MQTLYISSPSFPPIESLATLPWRKAGQTLLTVLLTVTAVCHALALRLWQHRGQLRPILVSMARILLTLADRLPDDSQTIKSKAQAMAIAGFSQRAIASQLGVTRYAVRQLLAT